ncbi:MAG: hypothetical protein CXX69_04925 [Candidatus Thalassarchaeum betae]|uniref:VTT domain-containing protein n=1 Tax=Candidatus Thalassarchaeum betae TaxID=2599289 RepID=A0A2V3HQW4_9ARCH|nr:MAG: hypothetical protein CXX69_04925 [Candidatus Thalassoarchaea betae]PXF25804.1 MAG: hypothetical protein CXX70_05945 [Euryarchaeota archaeon]HIC50488.1 hypothetical protein [Candidatus Poseidoniales archaeon]HIM13754.1 hypothetical protein [Candidatus Poseidoniales archaeon]HIM92933.1 hypothetical protein [Candidatus Poseidoniales archaeon]
MEGRRYVFEGITDSIIGWAEGFGLLGLAVVAAIEAALPFVPPDLLVLPLVLGAQGFLAILAIVLTATISSVFGSMLGYAFGAHAGRPAFERIVSGTTVSRLESMTLRYGSAGVFLAAISPIPYVAMAWTAGAGRMDLRLFVAAGLVGRGFRFGMEGLVLGLWGEEFLGLLGNPWAWLTGGLLALMLFIPLNRWWSGLIPGEDSGPTNTTTHDP